MSKSVRHGITCSIGLLTIQLKPLATPAGQLRPMKGRRVIEDFTRDVLFVAIPAD